MVTAAIKLRHSLLERKAMTNLVSILKSRDITLPTKAHLVKAVVFPVVRVPFITLKKDIFPTNGSATVLNTKIEVSAEAGSIAISESEPSAAISFSVLRAVGRGNDSEIVSRKVLMPQFLRAAPQNTGTMSPLMIP